MELAEQKTGCELSKKSAMHFTVLSVLFWLGLYFGNYLTVYLQSLGVQSSVIGYINSAAAATGMLGNFVVGRTSDRLKTVKWVCIVTLVLTGIFFILFPLTSKIVICNISLVLLWWPLACLFRSPASALVENWIVRVSYSDNFNYGKVRAGGSIGSFLSSILASALVTALYAVMSHTDAVATTYYASSFLLFVTAVYALSVRDVQAEEKKPTKVADLNLKRLFKNYYFVTLLVFFFALNVCINPPFVFLPYILSDSGIDTAKIGLIVGWEAVLELPMLFLLVPLRKKFSLHNLLIVSAILFAFTAMGQGLSHSLTGLLLCGTFFGFANSLSFSCGFNYIYCLAAPELRATAHALYTIAGSLGIIVGNMFAGVLIETIGLRPYYILIAWLTIAVSILYALSFIIGAKVIKTQNTIL